MSTNVGNLILSANWASNCLWEGKAKKAAKHIRTFYKEGLNNPAKAKLIGVSELKEAKDSAIITDDEFGNLGRRFTHFITKIKTALCYSKTYKAEKKAFDKAYKELYPNTHKMRDKLLKNESVQYYVGF